MPSSGLPALDLTRGPIAKTLLAFALPTLGSNALQSLNASVNAVWVGSYLGEAPLTAVTNSNAVLFLLMSVVFGIVMATGIMVGHAMGARDVDHAKRVVGSSASFIVILSLLTALLGAITARPILLLMGTPPDALPFAVSYMRLVFVATPAMFFYIYVAMTLRGAGDAKTPFIFMFVSVCLDIALNPLLIFGLGPIPAMGIAGSATAMLISQTTTLVALLVLVYLFNHTAVGFFLPRGSPAAAIATHINAIVLWSFVLFGGAFVLMGVVRATGAVIGPLAILFVSMWVVRIPFAYALAPRWQADAIWWSFPLGSLAALLMGWLYYQYGGWRKIQIMPHARMAAPQPAEG